MKAWRTFVHICGALIFIAIIYRWISLERLQGLATPEPTVTPTPEPTATKPPPMPTKVDIVKLLTASTFTQPSMLRQARTPQRNVATLEVIWSSWN